MEKCISKMQRNELRVAPGCRSRIQRPRAPHPTAGRKTTRTGPLEVEGTQQGTTTAPIQHGFPKAGHPVEFVEEGKAVLVGGRCGAGSRDGLNDGRRRRRGRVIPAWQCRRRVTGPV